MKLKVLIDGTWNEYEVDFGKPDEDGEGIVIQCESLEKACCRSIRRWPYLMRVSECDDGFILLCSFIGDDLTEDQTGFLVDLTRTEELTYTGKIV